MLHLSDLSLRGARRGPSPVSKIADPAVLALDSFQMASLVKVRSTRLYSWAPDEWHLGVNVTWVFIASLEYTPCFGFRFRKPLC